MSFSLRCFNQVQANIQNQVGQESEENVFELFVLSAQTQVFKCFFNEVANGFFVEELFQVSSLSEDNERLDHERHKVGQTNDDSVLVFLDEEVALLVFVFKHEVNAFQRLGLELVDQVIQNLQACDVDHAVVIW